MNKLYLKKNLKLILIQFLYNLSVENTSCVSKIRKIKITLFGNFTLHHHFFNVIYTYSLHDMLGTLRQCNLLAIVSS